MAPSRKKAPKGHMMPIEEMMMPGGMTKHTMNKKQMQKIMRRRKGR